MRKNRGKIVLIIVLSLISFIRAEGQLSPGALSNQHSNLEGMSNCTQCHVLGNKVSNEKCLVCHSEIKSRIDIQKGYHSSATVKGKQCFECHSEHNGKNFQIIRFDTTKFDHSLTGFPLSVPHAKKDCKECHSIKHIADQKIKDKKFSYLGVSSECLNCHVDYHQKELSAVCLNCHLPDSFKPASKFSHETTRFRLLGKHKELDCSKCHKVEVNQGKKFQKFRGIQFANCGDCHKDPHQNQYGESCNKCHNEESFYVIKGSKDFDHSKTQFPLVGKHKSVDCLKCHKVRTIEGRQVQEFKGVDHSNCTSCHKDPHQNKFGQNCSQCHNEESFKVVNVTKDFDHNKTGFKLEEKHLTVSCQACHKTNFAVPLNHNSCTDCHADYHKKQFEKNGISPDCSQCHSVKGFKLFSFSFEQHKLGKFPLLGAHEATPCTDCHKKQKDWNFKDIGINCNDCHKDIHLNIIPAKFYPKADCRVCHNEGRWSDINFNHSRTDFSLTGAHNSTECKACHFKKDSNGMTNQKFTGLSKNCSACHTDNHFKQFEKNGNTDCTSCHTSENWKASLFNHNNTAFKLNGKHINVACAKCHKPQQEGSNIYVKYKLKDFKCESCHL
jgi:hypothetical protein